jgi:uncharacterized protein
MDLVVDRHTDIDDFLAAAEPFLLADEAMNSLLLGVARSLKRQTQPRRRRPPVLATVRRGKQVTLAAVLPAQRKLLLAGQQDDEESPAALADHLARTPVAIPWVLGPVDVALPFARRWSATTGADFQPGLRQQLYKAVRARIPPDSPPGHLQPAGFDERDLLSRWVLAFQQEALPKEEGDLEASQMIADRLLSNSDLFVWRTGEGDTPRTVSMAARARPTVRGIAVNLVYTPPELRRHGYASACVAHLTGLLLESGWEFCTLFTDRTNATSNHIYRHIGYEPIADFDEYRFSLPRPGRTG